MKGQIFWSFTRYFETVKMPFLEAMHSTLAEGGAEYWMASPIFNPLLEACSMASISIGRLVGNIRKPL